MHAGGKGKGKFKFGGPLKKCNLGPQRKALKKKVNHPVKRMSRGMGSVMFAKRLRPPTTANAVAEIGELVANLTMDEIDMEGWYIDTSATVHVCDGRSKFVVYKEMHGKQVSIANGCREKIAGE
ncbi:hypothetical protein OSB04_014669 [Centaurea solstitialis]|uniref:Retrovirus-related Pol polyprotein from transposon TNT 1-94-like beta-barrel domain-containing protein n=1 Tax=Centaurea solstitialis TaxID=347529 RepID=A0AA38WHY8_9ASTR|nr:hypothetical protein OSB04_014669 [Centaurea solstitialis]